MKLVVIAPDSFDGLTDLRERSKGVEIVVSENPGALRPAIRDAEVIALAPRHGRLLRELWTDAHRVRWVHALGAGVESLTFEDLIASEVTLTNSRGVFADALAEFVVAAMFFFAKDLRRLVDQQRQRLWQPYTVVRLEGKTVGIVGLGGIGSAVARRAAALGMSVIGTRRRPSPEPVEHVKRMYAAAEIDDLIAASDYLVLCTPLTPKSLGLLSGARLERMKSDAVLINVSRGAVADEAALTRMLTTGQIRGAALDVFEQEPLPSDSPLWTLDNVLLSPHTADHVGDSHLRSMQFFIENLDRYRRGEAVENVVDKTEQY